MSIQPYTEQRPWGSFVCFIHNSKSTVKILHVKAGEAFSLQYHHHREEFWYILEGKAKVTVGDTTIEAGPGDQFTVPVETPHRVEGITDVSVLEVSEGDFDRDDIVRLDDKYGRPSPLEDTHQ